MIQLSPLTAANLHASMTGAWPESDEPSAQDRVKEVDAYQCTECGSIYLDEEDAEDCCPPVKTHPEEGGIACPICAGQHPDHREAADCCLWHDFDAPTRWRMADAVEAGSTWLDELAKVAA